MTLNKNFIDNKLYSSIVDNTEVGAWMYIPQGLNIVCDILSQNDKFLVYYDPDNDGLIAGHIACRFLSMFNKPYEIYINENRAHGFKLDYESIRGYTIIAVDFSMTKEEIQEVVNHGGYIINIDHHKIDYTELINIENKGVIINNQYCFEPEEFKFQSGGGMVYHVFSNICKDLDTKEVRALVGVSLLTDIRPIENNVAIGFLKDTYTCESNMFKYIIEATKPKSDYGFGCITMDRNYIDYTFSPKLNALFRLNEGYTAISLFNGTFDFNIDLERKRETQNVIINNIIANLEGDEYSSLIVKYVDTTFMAETEYTPSNFVGVACSRVKGCGKSSIIFVKDKENNTIVRGSFRGLYDNVPYLDLFHDAGINCDGHQYAFGLLENDLSKINFAKLSRVIADYEEKFKVKEFENRIIEVSSLMTYSLTKNNKIALMNVYVRDSKRVYLKYTGSSWKTTQRGKMWEYELDGVSIKCFDEHVTPENGYILPLYERGYIQFYLKNIKK